MSPGLGNGVEAVSRNAVWWLGVLCLVATPGVSGPATATIAWAAAVVPRCAIGTTATPASFSPGSTGTASEVGAVQQDCEPSLLPIATYGAAFSKQLVGTGTQPQVDFLPDGAAVAQTALPKPATGTWPPGYRIQELAASGQVLWTVGVRSAGTLSAGPGVFAQYDGRHLVIGDLKTRKLSILGAGGYNASYQTGVAGNLVVLLRTDWHGWSRAVRPTVSVFSANGTVVRRQVLPTSGFGAALAASQQAAFIVSGDTLFRVGPTGAIAGPFQLNGSYDQCVVAGANEVLVRSPFLTALVRVGAKSASTVWTLPIPQSQIVAGIGPTVAAGANLAAATATYGGITLWSTRTGSVIGRISQSGELLTPLAAGPFGVVAMTSGCPNVANGCRFPNFTDMPPNRLELFSPAMTPVWTYDVCTDPYLGWQPGSAYTYNMANATFLTTPCAPGMAVFWSGTASEAVTPGGTAGYLESGRPARLPPYRYGPIAGYAVFYEGKRIDPQNPLVITSAQAGQPVTLTVSAVNAVGSPVPSHGVGKSVV